MATMAWRTRLPGSFLLAASLASCSRHEASTAEETSAIQSAVTASCNPATDTCCPASGFTEKVLTTGADTFSSSTPNLCVRAREGADTLMVGPGAFVIAGPGNDTVNAWTHATVIPGEGADNVSVSGGGTVVINDLCETSSGKTLFGGGDGTLITPVPLAELQRHATVSGFSTVVVRQGSCHAACVTKPTCSGHGTCAEGASPGQVECACNPDRIGPNCEVPRGDLEACAARVPLPDASLPPLERERRYQADIARFCSAVDQSRCSATLIGRANVDYKAAALRLLAQTFSPSQYLALVRDRTRKLRLAEDDPSYAAALCSQPDADGDWVVNPRDRCPGTPDLTATDDDGCPIRTLPPGPDPADVKTVLDSMGMLLNPRCAGAVPPAEIPAGAFYLPATSSAGTFIFAGRVNDQPAGCPVFYQFDAQLIEPTGKFNEVMVLFLDREAQPRLLGRLGDVRPDFIQFNPRPSDAGGRGLLGGAGGRATVRFRVRAMNGNGARGPWSEWKVTSRADCLAQGFSCG
jgi:hypothetical protein